MAFRSIAVGCQFDAGEALASKGYLAANEYFDALAPDIHLVKSPTATVAVELYSRVLILDDNLNAAPLSDTTTRAALGLGAPTIDAAFAVTPGMDLTLDSVSGIVHVGPDCPLRNFIVRISIVHNGVSTHYLAMRIHVHQSTAAPALKLCPNPLSVRHGSRAKLTLLADFGGVPANLTNDPDVTWRSVGGNPIEYREGGAPGGQATPIPLNAVIPNGFFFPSGTFAQGRGCTIQAELPQRLGGAMLPPVVATANVAFQDDWAATPLVAEQIPTPGDPLPISDTVNVLILSEGYDDQERFEQHTNLLVSALTKSSGMFNVPFAIAPNRFGFLRAYVPSDVRGATCSWQLIEGEGLIASNADRVGLRAPVFARRNSANNEAGNLDIDSLATLVYAVGLPHPSDGLTSDVQALVAYWESIFGEAHIASFVALPQSRQDELASEWVRLAERHISLDLSTAFGLTFGDPPTILDHNRANFSPLRGSGDELQRILSGLKNEAQQQIGVLWSAIPSRNFIMFLVDGGFGIGQQLAGLSIVGLGGRQEVCYNFTDPGQPDLALVEQVPQKFLKAERADSLALLAHEYCHNFGLLDERGEGYLLATRTPIDGFNAQEESQILPPSSSGFTVGAIRWNLLLRASAAVGAKGLLVPVGIQHPYRFTITVRSSGRLSGNAFAPLDQVVLYPRPKWKYPTILPVAQVISGPTTTTNGDTYVIEAGFDPATNTHQDLSPFASSPAGDDFVMMRPVLPLSPLMDARVRTFLASTSTPLNRNGVACVADDGKIQRPIALPGTILASFRSRLVGLYDSGSLVDCGVFHPTGRCLMRSHLRAPDPEKPGAAVYMELCTVCAYAMIEQLSVELHRAKAVDAYYTRGIGR